MNVHIRECGQGDLSAVLGVINEAAKYLELVIREVGGVKERVFRWNLSPQ